MSLFCLFEVSGKGKEWAFTDVYDRDNGVEMSLLWDYLEVCMNQYGDRWIIGDDFNMILRRGEQSRGGNFNGEVEEFKEVMDRLNLVDLPLLEVKWTWSSSKENPSWSRIDPFFISNEFFRQLPSLSQKVIQRTISDHFPIYLISDGIMGGPVPFRFDNKWLKTDGFKSMVEMFWKGLQIRGTASFKLASKLKALKNKIKKRTKEFRNKLEESTRTYISELAKLDMKEMEGPLCVRDRDGRDVVRKEVAYNMNLETISCRQKAREKWLKEGDCNTKYFHCFANYKRKCNYVEEININSVLVRGNLEMRV